MKKNNLVAVIGIFLVVLLNSIVYGALNSDMFINGEAHVRVDKDIRITNLKVVEQTNGAYETYNSDYSKDTTSLQVALPSSDSVMVYEVTIINKSEIDYEVTKIIEESYSNSNIKYEIIDLEEGSIVARGTTHTFKIKITTTENNSVNKGTLVLKYIFEEFKDIEWTFDYTGKEKEFIVPYTGIYKLETWGAQGGGQGGNGGYSIGFKQLAEDEKLYVYVGEQGQSRATGAFNGGGACYCRLNKNAIGYGGGGATDIRTTKNNDFQDRIIVAGGGGGGTMSNYGYGYGGGDTANNAYAYSGVKNSYPANGAIGGNCMTLTGSCAIANCTNSYSYTSIFTGGGGGGYIGGVGISSNTNGPSSYWPNHISGAAAGGTGYVGGVESYKSIEARTIAGNQDIPTHDGLSTMKGNDGNGYAKITFLK